MRWHVIVTGASNPTQLIHVASRLRQILALGWCEQLTVALAGDTRVPPRITAAAAQDLLPDDARVRVTMPRGPGRWRFPADDWAVHVSVGEAGLAPYPKIVAANAGRRIPVVVTDEGLGSYGDADSLRDGWVRHGVAQRRRMAHRFATLTARAMVEVERWPLYRKVDGRWITDEAVAAEFRARIQPVTVDKDRVVMLTQPWVQFGATTPTSYRTHVRDVGRAIRRDGRHLVVRPHPAEDPRCYDGLQMDGITVLDSVGPAEFDPEVLAASEVLGGPSTAVLNVAALGCRPARIVAPPVRGVMSRLTADQRSLLDTHTRPFRSVGGERPVSFVP